MLLKHGISWESLQNITLRQLDSLVRLFEGIDKEDAIFGIYNARASQCAEEKDLEQYISSLRKSAV